MSAENSILVILLFMFAFELISGVATSRQLRKIIDLLEKNGVEVVRFKIEQQEVPIHIEGRH